MNQIKILIVEDNSQELAKAIEVVRAAGHDVVTATTQYEAVRFLPEPRWQAEPTPALVDAVISDIHFPYMNYCSEPEGDYRDPNIPCGVAIAAICASNGIPFVLCTNGYHHGNRFQWICDLGRRLGWPGIVDGIYEDYSKQYSEPGVAKDWEGALRSLEKSMAKSRS